MTTNLTERLQDLILELAEYLDRNGASEGLEMSRWALADDLGWPESRLSRVIRTIKEHPELGIGLSFRRGRYPMIVQSLSGDKLGDDMVRDVNRINRAGVVEAILRIARHVATDKPHHDNTLNKRSTAGRSHLQEFRHRRKLLVELQAELDPSMDEESAAIETIEAILQSVNGA